VKLAMTRVDVIIPCYNYGHFLRPCVESVLAQQDVEVRALILDDASSDHTADVAADLAARDRRLEVRRHDVNRGHITTYNEGLDWAEGDYTLLLSADDLLTPGALSRAVQLMDAHHDVGLTYGQQIVIRGNQAVLEPPPQPPERGWHVITGLTFLELSCQTASNIVPTPTALVRTTLQKKLGGYRKELPHAGDLEMWLRFAVHAPIGVVDTYQAYYRRHANNMSLSFYQRQLADYRQRQLAFEVFFAEYGDLVPGRERLMNLVTRFLAETALWTACHAFDRGDTRICQECLDFALQIYPSISSWSSWSNMRWKQLVGTRIWSLMRPLVDRLARGQATC
jgi:glycosyltransferase involved in cell wall biosynthesis